LQSRTVEPRSRDAETLSGDDQPDELAQTRICVQSRVQRARPVQGGDEYSRTWRVAGRVPLSPGSCHGRRPPAPRGVAVAVGRPAHVRAVRAKPGPPRGRCARSLGHSSSSPCRTCAARPRRSGAPDPSDQRAPALAGLTTSATIISKAPRAGPRGHGRHPAAHRRHRRWIREQRDRAQRHALPAVGQSRRPRRSLHTQVLLSLATEAATAWTW